MRQIKKTMFSSFGEAVHEGTKREGGVMVKGFPPAKSHHANIRKEKTVKIGNVGAFSLALVLAALPAVVLAAGNAENGKKIVVPLIGNCLAFEFIRFYHRLIRFFCV